MLCVHFDAFHLEGLANSRAQWKRLYRKAKFRAETCQCKREIRIYSCAKVPYQSPPPPPFLHFFSLSPGLHSMFDYYVFDPLGIATCETLVPYFSTLLHSVLFSSCMNNYQTEMYIKNKRNWKLDSIIFLFLFFNEND